MIQAEIIAWCAVVAIVWMGTGTVGLIIYWAYHAVVAIQACS